MDECLAEGVVATNEVFVASLEPCYVGLIGDGIELPAFASVAFETGEHEVPDLVEIRNQMPSLENMREEMVDISEISCFGSRADGSVAVEASALLVSVERISSAGDGSAAGAR
jgi:hypothetical protein